MRFFESNEIWEWCAERDIALDDRSRPAPDARLTQTARAYFAEGTRSGREGPTAVAAIDALGAWDECLLWVTLVGVWSSSEDWPAYYAFRGRQGERRSLEVAPGHWLAAGERELLATVLTQVLQNGWEAYVLPAVAGHSTGRRLFVSHDEFVELQANAPVEIRLVSDRGHR